MLGKDVLLERGSLPGSVRAVGEGAFVGVDGHVNVLVCLQVMPPLEGPMAPRAHKWPHHLQTIKEIQWPQLVMASAHGAQGDESDGWVDRGSESRGSWKEDICMVLEHVDSEIAPLAGAERTVLHGALQGLDVLVHECVFGQVHAAGEALLATWPRAAKGSLHLPTSHLKGTSTLASAHAAQGKHKYAS